MKGLLARLKLKIEIIPLARSEHYQHYADDTYGDWHDKPLRWSAVGPGTEIQKFRTRRDAEKYASRRRRSATQMEAISAYATCLD